MTQPEPVIEKNYLFKVLNLAIIPRICTLGLTWLSFPLMLRAVGPESFGTLTFIGSALTLFEALMDLGVSAASGKAIAEVHVQIPWAIEGELYAWMRLQMLMIVVGFGPMLLGAYLMVHGSPHFQDARILWVAAMTVCFRVAINFSRANLQSLLGFRSLAVIDTTDSVIRSLGLLVVAYGFPTVLGLALVGLVTAVTSSMLAVLLLIRQLRSYRSNYESTKCVVAYPPVTWTLKLRIRESLSFLWLRLAIRLFHETPSILLGRLFGAEIVGIIAVAYKLIEMLTTPYIIIGNALMVRVHEVAKQGRSALRELLERSTNIAASSALILAVVWILLDPISRWLFPDTGNVKKFFAPLLFLIPAIITSALYVPLSDYYGGLTKRNLFLSVMAIIQLGVLWGCSRWGNGYSAVILVVVIYMITVGGYSMIASRVLLGDFKPPIPKEAKLFILINLMSLATSSFISGIIRQSRDLHGLPPFVLHLVIFVVMTCAMTGSRSDLRRSFLQLGILRS
jgi:O-antigen/teichoic acid export membrane protein